MKINNILAIWIFSACIMVLSTVIGCKTYDIPVNKSRKEFTISELTYPTEIELRWDNPTNNVDNTPLTDLGGSKLYYGSESGHYTHTIDVGNVVHYTITNLTTSDRFFNATAYNSLGTESAYAVELRVFMCKAYYTNQDPLVIELEDVILDSPMTVTNDNYETYIYNPSNTTGYANVSLVYNASNNMPTSPLAIWIRIKSNGTNGSFDISHRGHSFSETNPIVQYYTNDWSFETLPSVEWHWEPLITNDSPITINEENVRDTFSISLSDTNIMFDKLLLTTNLNYNPNPDELPIIEYDFYAGTEFILSTNSVLLSWVETPSATNYKLYGKWSDTTQGRLYNYGTTDSTNMYVPMSRAGHFYYYIDSYDGTNKLLTTRSDVSNSTFFVHGYTNNLPWKIYWKLPKPGGIIIE